MKGPTSAINTTQHLYAYSRYIVQAPMQELLCLVGQNTMSLLDPLSVSSRIYVQVKEISTSSVLRIPFETSEVKCE